MASSFEYPKIYAAALFQKVILELWSIRIIPSLAEDEINLNFSSDCRSSISAFCRKEISMPLPMANVLLERFNICDVNRYGMVLLSFKTNLIVTWVVSRTSSLDKASMALGISSSCIRSKTDLFLNSSFVYPVTFSRLPFH